MRRSSRFIVLRASRCSAALIVGVGAGALVIPFILNLLNQAFGFEGGPPAIVEGAKTLAAPQATLISALARGVIGGDLRWDLIGLGAVIGVLVRFMFDRYKVSALYTGREPPPRIATPTLIELVPPGTVAQRVAQQARTHEDAVRDARVETARSEARIAAEEAAGSDRASVAVAEVQIRHPDAPAIDDGSGALSYRELLARVGARLEGVGGARWPRILATPTPRPASRRLGGCER